MPIKFRCEHCRQLLGISQSKAGEYVDCPTCGRSVKVPAPDGSSVMKAPPSWDSKDQVLLKAFDSLAALAQEPPVEESHSDLSEQEKVDLSREEKVSAPEPVPQPMAEEPVVLPEPVPPKAPIDLPTQPEPSVVDSPVETEKKADALGELASLAPSPPDASLPVHSPASQMNSTVSPSGKGPGWGLLIALVLCAFVGGYFTGRQGSLITEKGASTELAELETDNQTNEDQAEEKSASLESDRRQAIEGRISYRTPDGQTQADEGAVVVLFPAYRKGSTKLPIVGFRPADEEEDRQVALAAIRALGGEMVIVGEDGRYAGELPQAGEYYLLVLSRHASREETESIDSHDLTTLKEYFDRPQQLLGQREFAVGKISYRGEGVEIWDHAFQKRS